MGDVEIACMYASDMRVLGYSSSRLVLVAL